MLNLLQYHKYWNSVAERIDKVSSVLPVTIDDSMGKRIQALPLDAVTLFMFPPLAESKAESLDSYRERNHCVIFIMAKYDPQRRSSFDLLESTQPVLERIKGMMLADAAAGCHFLKLDPGSIEIAPETELYGRFAGWSMAFDIMS